MTIRKSEALAYHLGARPGKIEVTPTKPCRTQRDLSLANTPGVAEPCLEIAKDPGDAYKYTAKSNLVAVVSNGTAILGLGNIGALAGKPVMEGKGVLFKRFADVDVFDLEVNSTNPDDVIKVCQLLEPTFGGINLEDIKAPECFYIEETLKRTMKIPVFHDDQHGTAIISGAALLNALEVVGKSISQVRMVVNGSGAAGIACAEHYVRLGVKRENITLADTKGVVYEGRSEGMKSLQSAIRAQDGVENAERGGEWRGCAGGAVCEGRVHSRDAAVDGAEADCIRDGESRSRIDLRRSAGGAQGCDHRDRAIRFSESGEQRAGIPVHFPRRAGCACHGDQ
jgi:malate dehydrogenase (oxaloacetate-decarboxylating)(NADP+)